MRSVKLLSVLFVLAALTGCSYIYGDKGIIENRDVDYLKARSIPAMQIPHGLSSSTIQAHYPVSDRQYTTESEKVVLLPPNLNEPVKAPTPAADLQEEPIANPSVSEYVLPSGKKEKVVVPDYYFDNHSRAGSENVTATKAGMPIGAVFSSLWPWGNKHPAPAAKPGDGSAVATGKNNAGNNADNVQNDVADAPDADADQDDVKKDLQRHYDDGHSR